MPSLIVSPFGTATVVVPAAGSISLSTSGSTQVYQVVGYPNFLPSNSLLGTVTNTLQTFGPFASGATISVESGAQPTFYEVGTAPAVQAVNAAQFQVTPQTLNTTGTITPIKMLSGILTSTTAAAVTGTLATGTSLDGASNLQIGDSFDWSIINTGATNALTVAAATGHTIVGNAVVALSSSGMFRTGKSAAATYITWRIG